MEPKNGHYFSEIFRLEIVSRLSSKRIITTYLDNDDALNVKFVDDLQHRMSLFLDANFLFGTKLVNERDNIKREFAIDEKTNYGVGIHLFRFLPRHIKTFLEEQNISFFAGSGNDTFDTMIIKWLFDRATCGSWLMIKGSRL